MNTKSMATVAVIAGVVVIVLLNVSQVRVDMLGLPPK